MEQKQRPRSERRIQQQLKKQQRKNQQQNQRKRNPMELEEQKPKESHLQRSNDMMQMSIDKVKGKLSQESLTLGERIASQPSQSIQDTPSFPQQSQHISNAPQSSQDDK